MVVQHDPADIAARQHVRVALVDLGQLVLVGDGLVEQELALAIPAEQPGNVGAVASP